VQVRVVTRLVVAQAAAGAAVGLAFSRRHLPSVLITLALVVGLCLLALLVRSGTRTAWLTAVTFETVFFAYGVSKFVFARYVGGTLFAFAVAGTLLHPAVARAYSAVPGRLSGHERGEVGFGDATGETFGEHAAS
jgi:ribose/xylose/arabinose/galactoside ABC-type transport system permease subunit